MHILLIANASATKTNSRLFGRLADFLTSRHDTELLIRPVQRGLIRRALGMIRPDARVIAAIRRADTIIIHAPTHESLWTILLARAMGKRVIAYVWDIYPTGAANGAMRRFVDRFIVGPLEALTIRLSSRLVVPSTDFQNVPRLHRAEVMPLWPESDPAEPPAPAENAPDVVRICFAGQINPLRGLRETIAQLESTLTHPAELHIFSGNPLPPDIVALLPDLRRVSLHHRGFLPPDELAHAMENMQAGLISLHPEMKHPGFPSKIFDYLSSDLLVIYAGRPLPGYQGLLTDAGVGVVLDPEIPLDLRQATNQAAQERHAARQRFYSMTQLDWARLEKIL